MKNCKKLLLLVLALCLALAAVGCAPAEEAAPEVNVPVQDIADELLAMEDQFASMMDFGEEVVSEMCGLDYSLLEEASLNDAMMNVHARVLYIAKVKAGQIVSNGKYVMLVVSTDSQAVVDRFNEILDEAAAAA